MWRACLLFGTLAALARTSRADHLSLHGLLSGDLAFTDNEFAVPASDHPEADVFADIRPGLLFRSEGERFTNEVVAQAELIEYARHLGEPTYNGFASWKGLLLPSPRSDLALVADASTGKVNSLSARSASDQATVAVTSGGAASVRSADASEAFGYEATPSTRVTESVVGQWMATDDNQPMPTTTNTVAATADLGATRLFRHDSIGLFAGVTYLRLERLAPAIDVGINGSHLQNQLNPHATLSWLHDFSRRWSGNVIGGFVFVNPVGGDRYSPSTPSAGATGYPIATATIAYTDFWGHASVSGGRAVIPDLFIAENTLTDSVFAQATLPLYWLDRRSRSDPKLSLLGSTGYLHTQIIDSESSGRTLGAFDVGLVDLGLVWLQAPGRTFGVRYEFMIQHGNNTGSMLEPSFFRDTVYFTFDLRFPGDVLAKLPRSQSQSLRVDHSDVTPMGGGTDTGTEPVVPEAPAP